MLIGGKLLMVEGSLATSEECCCDSECDCEGERRPNAFNIDALGFGALSGSLSSPTTAPTPSNCIFNGCAVNTADVVYLSELYYQQPFSEISPIDWGGVPEDANGWPLPYEDTVTPTNPYCGGVQGKTKFPYRRERIRHYGKLAFGLSCGAGVSTEIVSILGVPHIKVSVNIGWRGSLISVEGGAVDRQYRYVHNCVPPGECGTTVFITYYCELGPWFDIAEQIDITALTYPDPIYNSPEGCLLRDLLNPENTCDEIGFIATQEQCLYLTQPGDGDVECPCVTFIELEIFDSGFFIGQCFQIWAIYYSNLAAGHFTEFNIGSFNICGKTLEACIHAEFENGDWPGNCDPTEDFAISEFVPQGLWTVTLYDADDNLVGGGLSQGATYEGFVPCTEWMSGVVTLDLTSPPGAVRAEGTYSLYDLTDSFSVPIPVFPSAISVEFSVIP